MVSRQKQIDDTIFRGEAHTQQDFREWFLNPSGSEFHSRQPLLDYMFLGFTVFYLTWESVSKIHEEYGTIGVHP